MNDYIYEQKNNTIQNIKKSKFKHYQPYIEKLINDYYNNAIIRFNE